MMYFVGILHRQSDLPATVSSVCAYSASLSSGGKGFPGATAARISWRICKMALARLRRYAATAGFEARRCSGQAFMSPSSTS